MPFSIRTFGAAALTAFATACASAPMPTEQLAVADQAVERAEDAGAAEFAAAELSTARDKLDRARKGAESRSIAAAEVARMAEQAEADARLAEASAQAKKAEAQVAETEENLRALSEEASRAADAQIHH